ncbi:MAG: GAF domain-containing protein [Symploca sp. SIO2B6]|nr:GAF domain-containing protein [Symploca sp. SIO2B6]
MTIQINQTFPASKAISSLVNRVNLSQSNSGAALLLGEIALFSQTNPQEHLYQRAVEGARAILQADRVVVYVFDSDWNGTIAAESVAPGLVKSFGHKFIDTCLKENQGGTYNNGSIRVIKDIYQAGLSACHLKVLEKYQVKASIVAPLLKNDLLFGLIIAHQCDQPRVWQPHHIDFFIQLSALISLRSGHQNFLEQVAKAGQIRAFSNVSLRLRKSLDPEEVLKTAAREIRQVLNADRLLICSLSPGYKEGSVVAESVVKDYQSLLGLPIDQIPCVEKKHLTGYKHGYVRAINNVLKERTLTSVEINLLIKYKIKASLVAPIPKGNELAGLIIAHQCSEMRTWEEPTINLLRDLGSQLGLALEQATLLQTVETERQRTKLLADFTTRVRQSLKSQDIWSIELADIRKTLQTDRVLIYYFNEDGKSGEITSQAVTPNFPKLQELSLSELFSEDMSKSSRDDCLENAHNSYRSALISYHSKALEKLQTKASMIAPIMHEDMIVGLLCAHHCRSIRDWQESELRLLEQLAAQIGFALDQAKLIEQVQIVSSQQHQPLPNQPLLNQSINPLEEELASLIRDVEGIAEGDLTVRAQINSGDFSTVAIFFNMIIESLQGIALQVKQSTTQVNSSLAENSGAVSQFASIANQQSQKATKVLGSVEQMSNSMQKVAERANQAAAVARSATTTAKTSGSAMERTAQKTFKLQETVATTAKKVEHLGKSAQKISQAASLINQIALQTNVLAVNAGVEATGAGEQGKNFAVFATQVGELAERSTEATKDIEAIVKGIQQETAQLVKVMTQGTTEVSESTLLFEETKHNLGNTLKVSRQIDQLLTSISQAIVSQVETSGAVRDLMKDMAKVSRTTSESSEQIACSLQQAVEMALQLQASVEVFKVDSESELS